MNKILKAGLVMQAIQIVCLVVVGIGIFLAGISWTEELIFQIIFFGGIAIFNIISIILIISGLIAKEPKKQLSPEYY